MRSIVALFLAALLALAGAPAQAGDLMLFGTGGAAGGAGGTPSGSDRYTLTITAVPTSLASGYTASGPSSGTTGVASTNFTVTATGGAFSGSQTVTISDGGGGGTFTPGVGAPGTSTVTVTPPAASASFTFTYIAISSTTHTLTFTNGQAWSNPGPLSYASSGGGGGLLTLTAPGTSSVVQGSPTTLASAPALSGTGTTAPYTVTVANPNNILTASGSATVTGSGTKALSISGSLAAVNSTLATIAVQGRTTPLVAPSLAANGISQPLTDYPTAGASFYDGVANATWVAWGGVSGGNVYAYVRVYNHSTATWSATVQVGSNPLAADADAGPGIVMDQFGFVHIFWGAHDSNFNYAVTTHPRDPSAWTAGSPVTVGGVQPTYVSPVMVNGNIWVVGTGRPFSAQDIIIWGGTPNASGAPITSWFGPAPITNFSAGFGAWSGNLTVNQDWICFPWTYVATTSGGGDNHRGVFYGCYNTVTGAFNNIDGSTAVPAGSLPISLTTAQAGFQAAAWPGPGNTTIIPAQAVDPNGITHLLYSTGGNGGPLNEAYFTSGAWSAGHAVGGTVGTTTLQPTLASTWNGVQAFWGQSANFPTTIDNAYTALSTTLGTWGAPTQFLAAGSFYLSMFSTVVSNQRQATVSPFPVVFSEVVQGGSLGGSFQVFPYNGAAATTNEAITFNATDSASNTAAAVTTAVSVTPWDGTTWNNPSGAPGLTHSSFVSASTKQTIGFNIYLPPTYSSGSNFPVVYWLNERTADENSAVNANAGVLQNELNSLIVAGAVQPMIAVFGNGGQDSKFMNPGLGAPAYSNYMGETQFFELMNYIDATYKTNASKAGRALQGFSMGGQGCEHIGFKFPELFSSLYCGSPAIVDVNYVTTAEPAFLANMFNGSTQAFANNMAQNIVARNAGNIIGLPITVSIGANDTSCTPVVSGCSLLALNQTQSALMTSLGITNTLNQVAGCGHDLTCVLSGISPAGDNWRFAGAHFPGAAVTTTFDPSFLGPDTTLSGGNLISSVAFNASGVQEIARSVASHSSGKYYFECTPNPAPNTYDAAFGIATSGTPAAQWPGVATEAANYLGSGVTGWFVNSTTGLATTTVLQGDTVGIALDAGAKMVWQVVMHAGTVSNWNASGTANPATNSGGQSISYMSGPYYAACWGQSGDAAPTIANTANFGGSTYKIVANGGSVPAGFGNW